MTHLDVKPFLHIALISTIQYMRFQLPLSLPCRQRVEAPAALSINPAALSRVWQQQRQGYSNLPFTLNIRRKPTKRHPGSERYMQKTVEENCTEEQGHRIVYLNQHLRHDRSGSSTCAHSLFLVSFPFCCKWQCMTSLTYLNTIYTSLFFCDGL